MRVKGRFPRAMQQCIGNRSCGRQCQGAGQLAATKQGMASSKDTQGAGTDARQTASERERDIATVHIVAVLDGKRGTGPDGEATLPAP